MPVIFTPIKDLIIFEPKVFEDNRGYFFESYNQKTLLTEANIDVNFIQDNQSQSSFGVIRGLHYQAAPYEQAKFMRVLRGEIFDVAVDLREKSPTFGQWHGEFLSAENKKQLFIPRGFAHGFAVISGEAEVFYKCDNYYNKEAERGIKFNDPEINIKWPLKEKEIILSEKDKYLPLLSEIRKSLNIK